MPTDTSLQIDVVQRKTRSREWLDANYYPQFAEVYQNYLCEVDPEVDPNDPTKIDTSQTALGMPDTYGWINRQSARLTAQIPNLRHRSDNPLESELISRTEMYQWDRDRMQRGQKKHIRQAAIFGWSVKAWSWKAEKFKRRKRVNILDPNITPSQMAAVIDFHLPKLQEAAPIQDVQQVMTMLSDPAVGPQLKPALAKMLAGPNGLIPVEYDYKGYEGPHSDVLFVGDCYPEPMFQSIQESGWFIVERRRNRQWLEDAAAAFPELADGIKKVFEANPNGTPAYAMGGTLSKSGLRERLMAAVGLSQSYYGSGATTDTGLWTISEMHTGGRKSSITYVSNDTHLVGTIPYPYDLDGWMAFTELTLIDNLLCGLGDSTARVMRGIQGLRNKLASQKADLVDSISNPLIFTSDRNLYENPGQVKRSGRQRYVYARGGSNAINWENNGPAIASLVASLNDESSMARNIQVATGDSNMSMAANVDPNQNRTATGARLTAFNQDILTKDAIDMVAMSNETDAEMMFRLDRSEFGDAQVIDIGPYNRNYTAKDDPYKQGWVTVEASLFQRDGHITAEVGSTLADDDEAKMQKSAALGQFEQNPYVNQLELTKRRLAPFVKTNEMDSLVQPPPPPPPPEDKTRVSISVSAQYAELPPQAQMLVLQEMAGGKMPPPPPPDGPPPPTGEMPPEPPPEGNPALMAQAAAEGNAPPVMEGGAQF